MTPFNPCDRATWQDLLTAEQVAVILVRKVSGLKKAAQQRTLVPAPCSRRPYRWRKADVVRFIDGPGLALRRAS